jgi:hypothetical protein
MLYASKEWSSRSQGCMFAIAHLSREPGVMAGVSPTLRGDDLRFFFSKYFLAKAESFAAYSFSITARSR